MEEYTPKHSTNPTSSDNKSPNKIAYYVAIAVAAALLIASIVVLVIQFFGNRENYDAYKNSSTESDTSGDLSANPINFDKLKEINPDVCAWIQIPGIDIIDYPILQSAPEADDNYYLRRDINGESKTAGCIYIQKLNDKDFSDPNTLIYGHDMRDRTMFGRLEELRNKEFFDATRTIYIYTPDCKLEYEIISAFVYDDRHIMNSFDFDMENERKEFFDECINPSSLVKQVREGATLTTDDKIITLSTCTNKKTERYLVVGKLISETKTTN